MRTFCKYQCDINVGSPYGLHVVLLYILYLYDQMWLVGVHVPTQLLRCMCQHSCCSTCAYTAVAVNVPTQPYKSYVNRILHKIFRNELKLYSTCHME